MFESGGVALDPAAGQVVRQVVAVAAARGAKGFQGACHQRGQVHGCAVEQDLAGHGARQVEQVVDDAAQVLALAFDDFLGPLHAIDTHARQADQRCGAADGAERIAQLVAQHGKKFVLGVVLAFGHLALLDFAPQALVRGGQFGGA